MEVFIILWVKNLFPSLFFSCIQYSGSYPLDIYICCLENRYRLFDLKEKYLIVQCILHPFNTICILFNENLHICTDLMKSLWKYRSIHQWYMTHFVFLWAYLKLCLLCVKVQKSSAPCDKLGRVESYCSAVSEACLSLSVQLIHAEVMHYGNYYQALFGNICSA